MKIFSHKLSNPNHPIPVQLFKMSATKTVSKTSPKETKTATKTSTKEPKEPKPVKLDADGNPIVKAPRLPEKFGKFIQFGFWLMTRVNSASDGEPKIDEEDFINSISLYGTVDEQTQFVQAFFDDSKENKKSIRKLVTAHKKANEPKKERKPRVKKPKLDADGNEIVAPPKEPKAPRAKKGAKAVANTQDELVDELVRRANSTDVPDTTATPTEEKPAPKPRAKKATATVETPAPVEETPAPVEETKATKSAAKPRAKKATAVQVETPVQVEETKTKTKKETKPKTKTEPKAKKDTKGKETAPPPQPEQQDEDDDTDVSLFEFEGKQYYIDDNDVVYDVQTQEELGNFDRLNQKINLN